MLYIFMGQSCTGKSTVADKMTELYNVEVFAGKDYLRMAKNENEAWEIFYEMLENANGNLPQVIEKKLEKQFDEWKC